MRRNGSTAAATAAASTAGYLQNHDTRRGSYSHPSHPHHHHHHHHMNKWRHRFSFCSTVPDHILPFPRHVVGTYSCHGVEPVYDSDYDSDNSDSDDSEGDDDDNGGNDNKSSNNNNRTTQVAKINQDRGGVAYPYANSATSALFAVYDGHGEGGELVSQYALGEISRILEGRVIAENSVRTTARGSCGLASVLEEEEEEEEGKVKGGDHSEQPQDETVEKGEGNNISRAMRDTFVKVDRGLLDEADIEVSLV